MYNRKYLLDLDYFIDNEYFDAYIKLLELNSNREFIPCQTNSHHVIPRHYFLDRKMNIDNSSDNKVNLLYKDHMLAHMYLSACTQGRNRYRNLYAISFMSGQRYASEADIDYVKQNLDNYQELYQEAINAAPNHWKGKKRSEITRKKMSEAQKGKNSSVKGKLWINDGNLNKAINPSELNNYLSAGWMQGRLVHFTEAGKIKMDEARRQPRSLEFREKMRQYGLNQKPRSLESIEKQSQTMKEYFKTHSGTFLGKKHTQETKELNRQKHIGKVAVHKDDVCKMIDKEQLEQYLTNGWIKGRKKLIRIS